MRQPQNNLFNVAVLFVGAFPSVSPVLYNTPPVEWSTEVPSAEWRYCAKEGATCVCPNGYTQLAFGRVKHWVVKPLSQKWFGSGTSAVQCTAGGFLRDPDQEHKKDCMCGGPDAETEDVLLDTDWTFCAKENGLCTCPATGKIAFGYNSEWDIVDVKKLSWETMAGGAASSSATMGIHCGSLNFKGNPAPGIKKLCFCGALTADNNNVGEFSPTCKVLLPEMQCTAASLRVPQKKGIPTPYCRLFETARGGKLCACNGTEQEFRRERKAGHLELLADIVQETDTEKNVGLETKENVCVILRTYEGHHRHVGALLQTLIAAATKAGVRLSVSLLNTDKSNPLSKCFCDNVKVMVQASRSDDVSITVIRESNTATPRPRFTSHWYVDANGDTIGDDYGYFDTDLELIWLREHGSILKSGVTIFDTYDNPARARAKSQRCDYYMFTNGDNLYMLDFFVATLGVLRSQPETGSVAVEFWSHLLGMYVGVHKSVGNDGLRHHHLDFMPAHIDLGCLLVRSSEIERKNLTFVIGDIEACGNAEDEQTSKCLGDIAANTYDSRRSAVDLPLMNEGPAALSWTLVYHYFDEMGKASHRAWMRNWLENRFFHSADGRMALKLGETGQLKQEMLFVHL